MPEPPHEQLRGWAAARRLSWAAVAEPLPATTPLLRRGRGAARNVCAGILPGGLGGRLAHQPRRPVAGDPDGGAVSTVVYAVLPAGSEVVRALCSAPVGSEAPRLAADHGESGSAHEAEGVRWLAVPATPAATLRTVVGPRVRRALATAPPGSLVELERGHLCVHAAGALVADEALDSLCHLGAELALALAAAARASRQSR